MNLIVVLRGKIEWNKYNRNIDIQNKRHGLRIKQIPKTDKQGNIKLHDYWYWSAPRTDSQKKKQGENFIDQYLGSASKDINVLAPIVALNIMETLKDQIFVQGDNLVMEKSLFEAIKRKTGYFHDGDVEVIDLMQVEKQLFQNN